MRAPMIRAVLDSLFPRWAQPAVISGALTFIFMPAVDLLHLRASTAFTVGLLAGWFGCLLPKWWRSWGGK